MDFKPLAEKIRPIDLNEVIGQDHLLGSEGAIRRLVESGRLTSFILWGPPGSGKTSIARLYARGLNKPVTELSAVSSGKADIKKIINQNNNILFLDEIHRFSKSQQDFLLPYVESGQIVLIGATTENPSFEIIPPLLSRLSVWLLKPLEKEHLFKIAQKAEIKIKPEALNYLAEMATGDARRFINWLEELNFLAAGGEINKSIIDNWLENTTAVSLSYDKAGDEHYNLSSAFIKSLRASQPDAAVYYLARMLEAGEDPKYIARRMLIFASEDIGLSQTAAFLVAGTAFKASEVIGYPEIKINLTQTAIYLAKAKKDRRVVEAYDQAAADCRRFGALRPPKIILNATTALLKKMGYGRDYELYTTEDLLPAKLKGKKYFKGN
ncbi:MAG: replication-associated recombination protein A [Patescibacteria group bacterium]